MELLRWILLGAGLFFVLIVYLLGRNRRSNSIDTDQIESDELPEFTANNAHDVNDVLSDVHITARHSKDVYQEAEEDDFVEDDYIDDSLSDAFLDEVSNTANENTLTDEPSVSEIDDVTEDSSDENSPSDIIILTVISRADSELHGDKINSAALANNLRFGDMNIFHRIGDDATSLFSMTNMVEPGHFDPATIHELRTPGLTFFLQLPVGRGASSATAALTDLLQCAYQVAEILGADLCNRQRKVLTEKEAEQLRELAKRYDSE